jgi:hypothetical protein
MNVFALRHWSMELQQAWGHHKANENIGISFRSIPDTGGQATNCEYALVISGVVRNSALWSTH